MKNFRMLVNGLSLGVICAGVVALSPGRADAQSGGTCCNQAGATCYLDVGGRLIIQSGAYYSAGACEPTAT